MKDKMSNADKPLHKWVIPMPTVLNFTSKSVKTANTVTDRDVRHLQWFTQRMGNSLLDAIIINTGPNAYRRSDGVGVVPLGLLAP